MARNTSHRFRRACGSSAADGSSRKTISGSWISAHAMDSRWAWPPESFSALVFALSVSATSSNISSTRWAGVSYSAAKVASCSRAVSRSKNEVACS